MTDAPKFTPGPWDCYADLPSTEPNWHIVTNESRMRVLANVHIEPGNAVDEANARLIAAAPELADVVKAFIDETVDYMTLNNLGDPEKRHNVKWARKVLSKAGVSQP